LESGHLILGKFFGSGREEKTALAGSLTFNAVERSDLLIYSQFLKNLRIAQSELRVTCRSYLQEIDKKTRDRVFGGQVARGDVF